MATFHAGVGALSLLMATGNCPASVVQPKKDRTLSLTLFLLAYNTRPLKRLASIKLKIKNERVFFLTYYNWGQSSQAGQQQFPSGQFPSGQFPTGQYGYAPFPAGQMTTPPALSTVAPAARREESYIENILRLNRGKIGTFYFTIPSSEVGETQGGSTRVVRGAVVEAGRDHAIIAEADTTHTYLFPMIYFDFAEFDEPLTYLPSSPLPLR